jgi:hypothetical protein
MFVPRALRLKGVKEPKKAQKEPPAEIPNAETSTTNENETIPAPLQPEQSKTTSKPKSGNRFTNAPVTSEYLQQLVCGVELIFTDHAHQDNHGIAWLEKHYRNVDGESNCRFASFGTSERFVRFLGCC